MGKTKKAKKPAGDNPYRRKPIEIGTISDCFIDYYRQTLTPGQMDESEFEKMISVYRTPLPKVFRLSAAGSQVEQTHKELAEFITELKTYNVDITELTALPAEHGRVYHMTLDKALLRRDERYQKFRQWLNLQTALGRCHQQEFVSMIPPNFLFVDKNHSVLDTCAAPGSKTAQILEMLGPDGFVIANDLDPRRCHSLVHQLQRVGTTNAMVVCDQAQYLDFKGTQFDRVLCDVPCTGDGTLRKNPSASATWTPKGGGTLHGVQRAVLKRGLELLKVGGICVYSTCSMNPIEDEAVVNSVLLELDGAVEIVDTHETLPDLKRHPGMKTWKVFDPGMDELVPYEKYDDVPAERRQWANSTMFPEPQVEGLERCMRFYPHDADSGGFFVTTLRKVKEFERLTKPPAKPPKDLREAPYIPITEVAPEIWEKVKDTFGLKEGFPVDQLFVRDDKSVRNIYFVSKAIAELIAKHGSQAFRTISCGVQCFTWKGFGQDKTSLPYASPEGLPIVMKYATKRVFKVTPEEMHKLLVAGHRAVPHHEFSSDTYEQFKDVSNNGCILYIPDTPFAYPGMTFKSSICVYLRKDLIPVELRTLRLAYPDLPEEVPPTTEEKQSGTTEEKPSAEKE